MIYISSSAISSRNIATSLQTLVSEGILNIELSGGTFFQADTLEVVLEYQKKYDVTFKVHNYFPPPQEDFVLNIASPDRTQRVESVQFIKKSITFAKEIGQDLYTFHAGYKRLLIPSKDGHLFLYKDQIQIDTLEAMKNMMHSLSEIIPHANSCGVKLGVENLFPTLNSDNFSLLCSNEEIFDFLKNTHQQFDVGMLIDLGHLEISANYFRFDKDSFLKQLLNQHSDRLLEIHLSGNNGLEDLHTMLKKDDWQVQAARKIASVLKDIPITIECRELTPEQAYSQYKMMNQIMGINEYAK